MSDRRLLSSSFLASLVFGLGFVALTTFNVVVSTKSSCATSVYPALPVCDPDYYKTLREKGWMEAMREVQVNNAIIAKPPSVLMLSCFDQHIKQMGSTTGNGQIFTDTGSYPSYLYNGINKTIGSSLSSFIGSNFNESAPSFSTGGSYSSCNRLSEAWKAIKCSVVDNDTTYGFLMSSLDQYRTNAVANKDVRGLSGNPQCSGVVPASRYTEGMKSSSDLADTASVRSNPKYFSTARPNFCAYDPKAGSALGDGLICKLPSTAGKKCGDMPAIPTGLVVSYTGGTATTDPWGQPMGTLYWSYRCLNPGCYFDVKNNAPTIKFTSGGTPPSGLKCTYKPY